MYITREPIYGYSYTKLHISLTLQDTSPSITKKLSIMDLG